MKHYKRGFLNKGEGFAAFQCNVTYEGEHKHDSVYANFSISDCNRQITLDFDAYDDTDYDNAMFKLTTLINELEAFKYSFIAAKDQYDKAQIEFKARKPEEEQ